jgi:putative oxidoreductase
VTSHIDARPIIPALSPVHGALAPLADPLIRLAAGGVLLVHGVAKLMTGPGPVIASMVKLGIHPAEPAAYSIMFLETFGAVAIILGLFTRFFATCLAIEMLVIAFAVQFPHGFSAPKGGYEMTLMWALIFIAIALRGGANYSVDRAIGWEL